MGNEIARIGKECCAVDAKEIRCAVKSALLIGCIRRHHDAFREMPSTARVFCISPTRVVRVDTHPIREGQR